MTLLKLDYDSGERIVVKCIRRKQTSQSKNTLTTYTNYFVIMQQFLYGRGEFALKIEKYIPSQLRLHLNMSGGVANARKSGLTARHTP